MVETGTVRFATFLYLEPKTESGSVSAVWWGEKSTKSSSNIVDLEDTEKSALGMRSQVQESKVSAENSVYCDGVTSETEGECPFELEEMFLGFEAAAGSSSTVECSRGVSSLISIGPKEKKTDSEAA
jgi:hypothetical protein